MGLRTHVGLIWLPEHLKTQVMCNDQVPEGYVFDNMFYNWQVYDTVRAPHILTSALAICLPADKCLLAARCMHSSQLHPARRQLPLPALPSSPQLKRCW